MAARRNASPVESENNKIRKIVSIFHDDTIDRKIWMKYTVRNEFKTKQNVRGEA